MYDVRPARRPVRPEVRKFAEPQPQRISLLLAAQVSYIMHFCSTLAEVKVENLTKWHQPTQQRVQKQRGGREAFSVERLRCRGHSIVPDNHSVLCGCSEHRPMFSKLLCRCCWRSVSLPVTTNYRSL